MTDQLLVSEYYIQEKGLIFESMPHRVFLNAKVWWVFGYRSVRGKL